MSDSLAPVETVTDAIEKLGGNKTVATLTGRNAPAVSNWKANGRFSAKTYVVLSEALARAGYRAPAALWGMTDSDALEAHDVDSG